LAHKMKWMLRQAGMY
jgi:hypothetical protein